MSSKDESTTCNPSHCGIITNISHPFPLRDDPPGCGIPAHELAYPGIREGDCSYLPRYFLSLSNSTDTYNLSYAYNNNNPYLGSLGTAPDSELAFDHVIYLNCGDLVTDDASYLDTFPCVNWGMKGEGGGHVYAVAGDLEAERLKPECRVKPVATIASDWRSFMKGKSYSYADIHTVLSLGFEVSWWPQACKDLPCAPGEICFFDKHTQKAYCEEIKIASSCYSRDGVPFYLFCGNAAYLSYCVQGLPFSKDIHRRKILNYRIMTLVLVEAVKSNGVGGTFNLSTSPSSICITVFMEGRFIECHWMHQSPTIASFLAILMSISSSI
ncbi:uncharacterized protein LOC114744926 [Neltuma alba]|uniref:uncharacterized protein LOC114744926 n=1 Tax=Neltuma alba TaxID=207710 RepID=UPI0010A35D85|nr:uncharacterized protein LOC114744926 [Prosopis alba]